MRAAFIPGFHVGVTLMRNQSSSSLTPVKRISAIGLRLGLSRPANFALAALTVASTAICSLAYVGPYRWLSELQLRVVGANYLALTVMLTAAGIGVALFGAGQLARRVGLLQTVARSSRRARSSAARFFSRARGWLCVAALGAACLSLGVRELRAAQMGGRLQRVAVAALEAGARSSSSWLQVEGKPFEEARIRSEPYNYIPLVSASWAPSQAVAVVLKLDSSAMPSPQSRVFRGMSDPGRLPVLVHGSLADMGFDVRRALVLEVGTTPSDLSARARWLLGLGGVLLSLGGLGSLLRLRRFGLRHTPYRVSDPA